MLLQVILEKLNINILNIPDNGDHNVNFALGIFILAIICLLSYINVIGYLLSIYLITKYNVEEKFPKFKKVIRYYEKSSLIFMVLEGLICLIFLLCIAIFSLIKTGLLT